MYVKTKKKLLFLKLIYDKIKDANNYITS